MTKKSRAFRISYSALFAAVICIGGFLKIPLGPVPVVLQNALCVLSGCITGGFWGMVPTLIFLFAGLTGLPVYSGGTGGIAVWLGPTGGFLAGYLFGALAASLIAGKPSVHEKSITAKKLTLIILSVLSGMIVLYIPGVVHFFLWAKRTGHVPADSSALYYTLTACVLPYIPGDILKSALCVYVSIKVRPLAALYLYKENK